MPPPTTLTHRGASPDSCPANGNSCDFGMEEITDQITPGSDCQKRPWETLVIIEFSNKIPPETVRWITSKITSLRKNGGGEMLATTVLDDDGEETILHVSASTERLLLAAELMELKKPYNDGSLKEVTISDLDGFQNTGDLDCFLTQAEKQKIISHELENIRAVESEPHVVGIPQMKLYAGETVIPKCMSEEVILKLFPLHNKEVLKALGSDWYAKVISAQPIGRIQQYFGETIAMYFAFLGYYTMALIPPALIGILTVFWLGHDDVNMQIFFSIFNIVWATIFMEAWKQNCSTLAFQWGTINMEQFEEARPQYYGVLGVNKITGRLEPSYPKYKRSLKFYCVSLPVVLFCLFLAFLVMLGYFWLQENADIFYKEHHNVMGMGVVFMPSLIYAIVISIMNAIYRKLAKALNDWENHRLQSAYDNHLITKLVLFDFSNCFMSLFYVAFYMQDMTLLRSHLGTLLIVQQVIGQVREALIPYLMYKNRKRHIKARSDSVNQSDAGIEPLLAEHNAQVAHGVKVSSDSQLQARIESSKDEYDVQAHGGMGTLDDYLEMFLQFGYVFLFSSVFPSAAFWALLNNITEIRTDSFKMCRIFQRPFSKSTAGIGAWMIAFEIMMVMAVITNCALIGLSPQIKDYAQEYGAAKVFIMFVIAEHVLLFIKFTLSFLIPDAPDWVQTAIGRQEYQSKQAWRKERSAKGLKALKSVSQQRGGMTPTVMDRVLGFVMTDTQTSDDNHTS